MHLRSPRSILALSAALTLALALAPTATFAKGPGGGNSDCDGDCIADQPQAQQQTPARDGSGQQTSGRGTATRANAGGGGQVQARAGDNGGQDGTTTNRRNARQNSEVESTDVAWRGGLGRNAKDGAGRGPNDDGERGPGTCEDCDAVMGRLTEEQIAGLVFMANEEKLAGDIYAAFAEQYGVPIFGNIARSEARHQEAVNVVLQRYGIEDRAVEMVAGEFSDPLIASLYANLIEQGSASLEEAIAVGVLIEETDIADLESRMAGLEETAPDVHEMYSHLLAGSQNHLSAFEGWL